MRRTGLHPFRALLAACSIAFGVTPAFSATVVCAGTVSRLEYTASGNIMLQLSGMNAPVFICSLDSNWNIEPGYVTTPATCKTMYASFLAAKLSGTSINDVYFDGPSVPASCTAWALWTYANIRHYYH
jgi:hypothetical protein